MNTIYQYPYLANLTNDLDNNNVYFTENGLECLVYGQSILLCKYETNKPRVRLLNYEEVSFICKRTHVKYTGFEIDFFGGPTIYLSFEDELVVFVHEEIKNLKKHGVTA